VEVRHLVTLSYDSLQDVIQTTTRGQERGHWLLVSHWQTNDPKMMTKQYRVTCGKCGVHWKRSVMLIFTWSHWFVIPSIKCC